MTRWRETFERAAEAAHPEGGPAYRFGPPATAAALADLGRHLGAPIPPALRALLAEVDGIAVRDRYWGPDWQPLYFSVGQMLRDVPEYLATSGNPVPPADALAAVAFVAQQNGFADLYAVCLQPVGAASPGEVVALSHETGTFRRAEASLAAYVGSPRYTQL